MATFLKIVTLLILTGGITYGVFCAVTPDEAAIAKHLSLYSSHGLFETYKQKNSTELMKLARPKLRLSFEETRTRDSTSVVEK